MKWVWENRWWADVASVAADSRPTLPDEPPPAPVEGISDTFRDLALRSQFVILENLTLPARVET